MSDLNKYVEKIVPSSTANATPLKKCEKKYYLRERNWYRRKQNGTRMSLLNENIIETTSLFQGKSFVIQSSSFSDNFTEFVPSPLTMCGALWMS